MGKEGSAVTLYRENPKKFETKRQASTEKKRLLMQKVFWQGSLTLLLQNADNHRRES